jgi:hypothetical protein
MYRKNLFTSIFPIFTKATSFPAAFQSMPTSSTRPAFWISTGFGDSEDRFSVLVHLRLSIFCSDHGNCCLGCGLGHGSVTTHTNPRILSPTTTLGLMSLCRDRWAVQMLHSLLDQFTLACMILSVGLESDSM